MDIRVQSASVTEIDTPLLVVNLFEGVTTPSGATGAVDSALGGQISRLIADGEIRGEPATVTVIHNAGSNGLKAQRVAVVGLGKQDEFDLEAARIAAATGARQAESLRLPMSHHAATPRPASDHTMTGPVGQSNCTESRSPST